MSEEKATYGTPRENGDTSPMIRSRRIERPIQIEERNDPPMPNSFDTTVVYPSTALPEWFKGLQSIVEDETFTQLVIILGEGRVRYFITVADPKQEERKRANQQMKESYRAVSNDREKPWLSFDEDGE